MVKRSKDEMLANLKVMLEDVFRQRREGAVSSKLARTHGYLDGYMRAMLDGGLVGRDELLDMVARERADIAGPATRTLEPEAEPAAAEADAA